MSSNAKIGLEIERKYIIEFPDIKTLSEQEEYSKSEIVQIYISSADGETHRIRRRSFRDREEYTETQKRRIDEMSVIETEREISEQRFGELAADILPGTSPVIKTRHCFISGGQLFEIDVYPQWKHTAIMETELSSRGEMVDIPAFIKIIRQVTGDKSYSNAAMSRAFPDEIE